MQMNVVKTVTVRGQSQGLDRVEDDLNKVSAAQERVGKTGEAVARVTETSTRRQLSASRDFQRLMERQDRVIYLQNQLARETSIVNRAFEQGAIDATRHAAAIELVEGKYQGLVSAEERARTAAQGLVVANDNQAASLNRLAAANDNARGSTANVAAQFQDIGVTAAMGMSPIMIALQQGTQLSAVLSTMQNPLRGLAGAFMSLLNPVSLLTIGFVALSAAAIQFFMGADDNDDVTGKALERHIKLLDDTLEGYEAARDAAKNYLEGAATAPIASVKSDLGMYQEDALKRYEELLGKVVTKQTELQGIVDLTVQSGGANEFTNMMQGVLDIVTKAGLSTQTTAEEFDNLHTTLTLIKNSAVDDNIRYMAEEMLNFVAAAREGRSTAESVGVALSTLAMDDLSGIQDWADISNDTRLGLSLVERAAQAAAWAIANSGDAAAVAAGQYGTATGAANAYANAMFRLGSLIPEVAAAQAQFGELKQAESDYSSAIRENQALLDARGISLDEFAQRQQAANDLYQRAQDQVTGLTDATKSLADAEREASIGAMAPRDAALERIQDKYADIEKALTQAGAGPTEFARATAAMNTEIATSNASFDEMAYKASGVGKALEKAAEGYDKLVRSARQFIAEQQLQAQALGQSAEAANSAAYYQEMLNKAANDNIALGSAQRQELAGLADQMAATEAATARLTDIYNFGKQTFGMFMQDFRKDLMAGTGLWQSFANAASNALDSIASKMMEQAANGLWDILFNAAVGGLTGGFGTIGVGGVGMPAGGFTPGISGPMLFASGGYTGNFGLNEPAGVVHGQEYVMNAAATRNIGRSTLDAMNAGRMPSNQNQSNDNTPIVFQMSAVVQAGPGATEADGAAAARGWQAEMKRWKESPDAAKFINGVVNKKGRH